MNKEIYFRFPLNDFEVDMKNSVLSNNLKTENNRSFSKSKIIGIDIDDTITNIQKYMLEEASKYDRLINGNGIIDNTKYLIGEKYGWSEAQKDEFFKKYRLEVIENAKIRSDCIEYLNKIMELGYKIIIITARSPKYYDNPYEYTKKWLDDNKIPYNKLIVNAKSKKEICLNEGVSIFVDDMPSNCLEVSKLKDVKVYIMDNFDNNLENNNIKRIKNFKELYENIIKYEV